jgi:hypothetical protein
MLSDFVCSSLGRIETEIKLTESTFQKNCEIVNLDYVSKFKNIIESNAINKFFNFEYELLLKEDFLVLELHLPSFDRYSSF